VWSERGVYLNLIDFIEPVLITVLQYLEFIDPVLV
jgi:hypothetical protein